MTLVALALAIVACIGWELHTRVLRRALHAAWADNDKQTAAPPIDDLLADTQPFALADYQRERAKLERQFLAKHGTQAEDIDTAIHRGVLPCNDPLVEEWAALQALAPYVNAEDRQP